LNVHLRPVFLFFFFLLYVIPLIFWLLWWRWSRSLALADRLDVFSWCWVVVAPGFAEGGQSEVVRERGPHVRGQAWYLAAQHNRDRADQSQATK
jgi:hypothetical protein